MKKVLSIILSIAMLFSSVSGYAQTAVGTMPSMVSVSPAFAPALIRGLTVHKDNPFLFDFIVDPGQSRLSQEALKDESDRMIRYFFASLTIPDKDIWVNLSPYEKDRMIPGSLGKTVMGRDLLAQDYLLKQLSSSLIYPKNELGNKFWDRVYTKAREMYGTTQVPVDTFNKVWIVPQKAGIYEQGQTGYIVDGHLKVMLEEDYLATAHNAVVTGAPADQASNAVASKIIREIILPEIEKEVNEGQNFATLRQIFYAQVLAVWFKRNLKEALLNKVYANKSTVKGIDSNNKATNQAIYDQYLSSYKNGVFNFIQEDTDSVTQESLPRKYFSGGYGDSANLTIAPVNALPRLLREGLSTNVKLTVLATTPKSEKNQQGINAAADDAGVVAKKVTSFILAVMMSLISQVGLASPHAFGKGWSSVWDNGNKRIVPQEIKQIVFTSDASLKAGAMYSVVFGWKDVPESPAVIILDFTAKPNQREVVVTQEMIGSAVKKASFGMSDEFGRVTFLTNAPDASPLTGAVKIDKAGLPLGGIDLSQQDGALRIEKDAHGGVIVNVDQAMIRRVEREGGLTEVVPVIINMQPVNGQVLFK